MFEAFPTFLPGHSCPSCDAVSSCPCTAAIAPQCREAFGQGNCIVPWCGSEGREVPREPHSIPTPVAGGSQEPAASIPGQTRRIGRSQSASLASSLRLRRSSLHSDRAPPWNPSLRGPFHRGSAHGSACVPQILPSLRMGRLTGCVTANPRPIVVKQLATSWQAQPRPSLGASRAHRIDRANWQVELYFQDDKELDLRHDPSLGSCNIHLWARLARMRGNGDGPPRSKSRWNRGPHGWDRSPPIRICRRSPR